MLTLRPGRSSTTLLSSQLSRVSAMPATRSSGDSKCPHSSSRRCLTNTWRWKGRSPNWIANSMSLTGRPSTPFSLIYQTKLKILLVTKARTCPSADFRRIVLNCQRRPLSSWDLSTDILEYIRRGYMCIGQANISLPEHVRSAEY